MKFIVSAALLLLAGNFARAGDHRPDSLATDDDIRSLAVGTVELIDVDFAIAPNPTVGNKTVIEAQQGNSPRQIKLIALKKGTTSVIIYKETGEIARKMIYNVISDDLSGKVLMIRKLLYMVEGITIESAGDKIVIDGELLTTADRIRVSKVAGSYPEVLDLTTMSKLVR